MKSYTKSKDIHSCRLNRADLFKLVEIIESDFPEVKRKEDFEISTSFNGLNISENSIEDFLNQGLPGILSQLSFSRLGWSANNNIDKSLSLLFYNNFISLNINGDSEAWVKGKFIQITEFLKTKRPFFWFFSAPASYIIQGGLVVAIPAGLTFMVLKIFKNGFGSIGIWLPFAILFSSLLSVAVGNFRHVLIYSKDEKPFTEKYKGLFLIITAIGSIASFVGFILQLLHLI